MKEDLLGKKIKSLRLAKGMTQAALSGDTITRNMLSQIENGVAQPSVATITQLAERLDTPVEYFFSESTDLDAFRKIGAIGRIRKLYAAGEFAKCIARLEALGVSDDETEMLFANAYYERGVKAYREGMLRSAASFFRAAIEHAEKSVYVNGEMRSMAERYLCVMQYIDTKDASKLSLSDTHSRRGACHNDILYICAIAGAAPEWAKSCSTGLCREHLTLRAGLENADTDALEGFISELRGLIDRCDEEGDMILKYHLYCDLEKLASRCGDYKCAYECSSERLLLSEKMNH